MLNPFALLAIGFGVTAVILLFALLAMADSHRQWRLLAENLTKDGDNLVAHCTALESRNDFLESEMTRLNELRAAGTMFIATYRASGMKMAVRHEEGEMP